jgi:hypothetical protein
VIDAVLETDATQHGLRLGFNLFGDTLRDAWDPKLRG